MINWNDLGRWLMRLLFSNGSRFNLIGLLGEFHWLCQWLRLKMIKQLLFRFISIVGGFLGVGLCVFVSTQPMTGWTQISVCLLLCLFGCWLVRFGWRRITKTRKTTAAAGTAAGTAEPQQRVGLDQRATLRPLPADPRSKEVRTSIALQRFAGQTLSVTF